MNKQYGFTLLELLTSLSIMMLLITIGMPSMANFTVKMRVDREISQLYRMLLMTRNSAINSGQQAIICPLNKTSQCTSQWQNELSIFIDINNNKILDNNEKVISIKDSINSGDKLVYGIGRTKITFKPTGQLSGLANGTFRYCPKNHKDKARGIIVARSGRIYQSSDTNNDGIDENRGNKKIKCE